ncbi:unnamed protein product [Ectocarpus sp. CCAP 1310/34]|nr:unnamed protein product [Ectocarpus sp. CCAP 1310/34]
MEADQAAAARALAQAAALRARDEAEQSKLGVPLSNDLLREFRLVLLKTGGKVMSALAQKTFQAFPIAYAAITCKQSEQMDKGERDVVCTKTLVEFAIPQFIVLAKAAAKKLELPLPLDIEDKMYLTSLGTDMTYV